MNISDTRLQNFRQVLSERKLRLVDVADLLGKAPAQVSAFGGKNPTKGIGNQIAREIEAALTLPIGYLDYPGELRSQLKNNEECTSRNRLPVLGAKSAIRWLVEKSYKNGSDVEEWVEAPDRVGPNAFAFRVEGLSMSPHFKENDRVIIDPSLEVNADDYVLVKDTKNSFVTIKQLKLEGDDEYLVTLNPDWPDRIQKVADNWTVFGKAKWKISEL